MVGSSAIGPCNVTAWLMTAPLKAPRRSERVPLSSPSAVVVWDRGRRSHRPRPRR
ncbi:MAG: hypothetical protein MZV64_24365 [Ignavibacteriales bacterium]|nr:hypothetical protein [Ignavibacteriales bacterium]